MAAYSRAFVGSPAYKDLWAVRNVRPAFGGRLGTLGGVLYAGVDTMLGGRVPWTLQHHGASGVRPLCFVVDQLIGNRRAQMNASTASPDALATRPAERCAPIAYPAFEPPLSTDLLSSVTARGDEPR